MRVIIWGAGGHGKVVADVVRACGHEVAGYVDVDESRIGEVVEPGGARIFYTEDEFLETLDEERDFDAVALAVGDNAVRLRNYFMLVDQVELPSFVHPTAVISPGATIGQATMVTPNVVINAGATVGRAVILNSACVVEHDCEIADGVHVSPNATLSGNVRVDGRAWIGAGSVVIQGKSIGAGAVVGAGACVITDVEPEATVVGVPSRRID